MQPTLVTELTIKYALTPKDFDEAANRTVPRRVARVLASALVGSIGLLFLCWHYWLMKDHLHLFWRHWQANLFILVFCGCSLWFATGLVGYYWFLKRFTQAFSERQVTFRGDLITVACGKRQSTMRWSRERGCVETTNLIVLFDERPGSTFIVPKRALNEEQAQQLREVLDGTNRGIQFAVTFPLTEADVLEASEGAQNWLSSTPARVGTRILCGLGAAFFLYAPGAGLFKDVPNGWAGLWRTYPAAAVMIVAFSLLASWAAAGQPGLKSLVHYLNHYGQQQMYTFSDAGIHSSREGTTQYHSWKKMLKFRETQNAFILQTHLAFLCYIIPKSSLAAHQIDEFRKFLLTKLPEA